MMVYALEESQWPGPSRIRDKYSPTCHRHLLSKRVFTKIWCEPCFVRTLASRLSPRTCHEACPFACSYLDNDDEIAISPPTPAHVGNSIFGRRWCSTSNRRRHQCSSTRRIFFASSADSQGIRCCCCHFGGSLRQCTRRICCGVR